jgi:diguanylate cyclase (GGDEF)-like protein
VVLLIDANLDSATFVAERIRASIAGMPFDLPSSAQTHVSVSIGVASLPAHASELPIETVAQQLVAHADQALYQAKANGRNQVVSAAASVA